MEEKELFKFGDKELNVTSLLHNITSNLQSYLDYYSTSIPDFNAFIEKVNYIKQGIKDGSITTDGTGVYHDSRGKLNTDDKLMSNALHYVNTIAKEQSKYERSLTQSEINQKENAKKLQKEDVSPAQNEEKVVLQPIKPLFTPPDGWNVANSFAHSFNQNGQIPYDLLQRLVTTDSDGNPVYTDLHNQLDKNFDSVSKQLELFSGTESYINNINLFKTALKDGDLSPQDRFLGMELGFLNSEMDKLNALIKYKVEQENPEPIVEEKEEVKPTTLEFVQNPLESDASFRKRIDASRSADLYYNTIMNSVNFERFLPAKKLKLDSEDEFKKYLRQYIRNWVIASNNPNWTIKQYTPGIMGHSYYLIPSKDITLESLSYMDPKLYNELGLKYFSTYSASQMYKHFKDLVDKQNKESAKYAEGGVLKAQLGGKTPWRLNFDGSTHQMNDIYKLFTDNAKSYDAKQMADSFNKLNSDSYKTLNFGDKDNTLGFRDWNKVFNESGLNNLFGYNDYKADYLGVTTRSRRNFVDYLKNLGNITTGNGILYWNPTSNLWDYSNLGNETPDAKPSTNGTPTNVALDGAAISNPVENTDAPNSNGAALAPIVDGELGEGSQGQVSAPTIADLTLKGLGFKKPIDFNPNGVINSLIGYLVNDLANIKKRKIQKELPIYLEVMSPEKAFRTPYTYDLEKAKGEIMAEAHNIQPITSDASVYYAAKNDAIKNARAHTTRLNAAINDIVHQTADENSTIAYENAVRRTENVNTNAKYRHDWDVEQKLGEVDYIEARNLSFLNLNKEFKHNIVTEARRKQRQRDAYVSKHILTGVTTSPSNYIDGWTKHHDLIWYKGLNGQLSTDQELVEYQQLMSVVNQAASALFALYENIKYPGLSTLHVSSGLKEEYDPAKQGIAIQAAKGAKIDKMKIGKYINKLK